MTTLTTCPGCHVNPPYFDGGVCMDCVRARQKAAFTNRCKCGRKAVPLPEARVGSRAWIPCNRCLGTIRQTG